MKSKYIFNFLLTLTIIVGVLSSPVLASTGRPTAIIPDKPVPDSEPPAPQAAEGPYPISVAVPPTPSQDAPLPANLLQHAESNATYDPTVPSAPTAINATILLDQPPNQTNGVFSDEGCDICGSGVQVIAENFVLGTTETINQIIFWSGYFPNDIPIDPDVITVIFHNDAAGFPGAAISTEAPVPYSRVQTGGILFGVHEWMHTLTLANPVTLGPGTYWVEIYNDTGFGTDDFFWETGNLDPVNGIAGSAWATTAPGSGWSFDGATDMAIQLISTGTPGWLDGYVMDSETGDVDPTCTDAVVYIEPGNLDVSVDASGYYTTPLCPFTPYTVTATAPGYSVESFYPVVIVTDTVTTVDFNLWRPVVEVTPPDFISYTAFISVPTTYTLAISNNGHLPLDFEIQELPPPILVNAMSESESNPGIEVEPVLLTQLEADETSDYMIYFRERPDLAPALEMDWQERGWFVMNALQAAAERAQDRVRAYLDAQGADYQTFWIDNVIVVHRSDRATFDGLMGYPEIAALRAQRIMGIIEPADQSVSGNPIPMAIEPNISHVNANQVWGLGFMGEGMIVANIDTGVRYTHEALEHHYRGCQDPPTCSSFSHDYNWLDPDTGNITPFDDHGHGSHTIGTMVGDDTAHVNQIGMAPGARWIACDACNAGTGCPGAALLTCAQWIAAPYPVGDPGSPDPDMRPHVVNNSWGDCDTTYDNWYQASVDSWHAAGIYPVFSNGNASNCGYPEPPGCNTVGNPARYGNVTGVGSTGQSNGQYAIHSNWGPTDNPDAINPRGYPTLKPQVVAPGVNIRSSLNGSDNQYASWGGTSMSAPHVAALVALMWQAGPCLVGDYATTETFIEQTAVSIPYASGCGGEGPGNVPNMATGWGEIDALAAVQAAQDYCNTNWLPWVSEDPISGTVDVTSMFDIDVTFHCTETRDYTGTLRILHNDPCAPDIDVPIVLHCLPPPPPEWTKWINGTPWTAAISVTVETSDTIEVIDVITSTFPFSLTELWNPAELDLVGWDVAPPGLVPLPVIGPDFMYWDVPSGPPLVVTLTKLFHVEPSTWTLTLLSEELWVDGGLFDIRLVPITKLEPDLWIDVAPYLPDVLAGEQVSFTLLYGNDGGYENDVGVWNDFPPEAPFVSSIPAPDNVDPGGLWAEWLVGDLAMSDAGNIEVSVAITDGLPVSTTVEIWDYIYNHVGWEMDAISITYHITDVACIPVDITDVATTINDCVVDLNPTYTGDAPITWAWVFDNGTPGASSDENPTGIDFGVSGTYAYTATATNCNGTKSDTYVDSVTVSCAVCEPITAVDFEWSPFSPTTSETVTFTGTVTPPAATMPAWQWDFGDGGTSMDNPAYHNFPVSNTYTVWFTASNACSEKAISYDVRVTGEVFTPTYGVGLTPATGSDSSAPGDTLTYTLTVENTGDTPDTFDLSYSDVNGWTTSVLPAQVNLVTSATAEVIVTVDIPGTASNGDDDTVTVTATSQGDGSISASSVLTTTASVAPADYFIYLPLVLRNYSP